MKYRTLFLCSLVLALPALAHAGMRTYTNERFGVAADVPADWQRGWEPTNGDGLNFTSPDGKASVTVAGGFAADETMDFLLKPGEGETITYRYHKGNVVVVSGTRGNDIFYDKSMLLCGGRILGSVRMLYPAAQAPQYDSLVRRIAKSLRQGKGAECASG